MPDNTELPERPIGEEFMERTLYRNLEPPAQKRGVAQPPLVLPADPSLPQIALPARSALAAAPVDLLALIDDRRSMRDYAPDPLTMPELSYLLWCTQGVLQAKDRFTLRTVPSAGARHAFETYLLINRVESLEPGLYRYFALEHALQPLPDTAESAPAVAQACLGQSMLESCAVAFIWTAVTARMTWRYGQRGYRYLHLDAGHVCQNLYLAAESIHCGACAIAAFDDEAVNTLLCLDGEEQFAIYLATVGRK